MSLCEIHDINIVPQACAILGRIVISEYAQAFALSDCSLGDERDQIVRDTAWQFPDQCGRMSSYRVEIAQGYSLDTIICRHGIPEDIFTHLLRIAIRRSCRKTRSLLSNRKQLSLAIDCGRGREQHIASALLPRLLEDIEERQQIVAVIHNRLRYRFADRLECSEMNHRIYGILCKKFSDRFGITAVYLIERDVIPACDLLHTFKACHITI